MHLPRAWALQSPNTPESPLPANLNYCAGPPLTNCWVLACLLFYLRPCSITVRMAISHLLGAGKLPGSCSAHSGMPRSTKTLRRFQALSWTRVRFRTIARFVNSHPRASAASASELVGAYYGDGVLAHVPRVSGGSAKLNGPDLGAGFTYTE